MPTAPLSSLIGASAGQNTELKPTGKAKELGRQDFLQLLVSQLKNQDPLNPMEGAEFTAQLAQFSSVEQLVSMNAGMKGIVDAVNSQSQLSQTSFAAGLLGRTVIAEGNASTVDANGVAKVMLDLPAQAEKVTVQLLNSAGAVVAEREFDGAGAGRQTLQWKPEGIAAGTYRYAVQAEGKDGKPLGVRPLVLGAVQSLQFKDGRIQLQIGSLLVPMDQLLEISAPDAS